MRLSASAHLRVNQTDTVNGDQRDWAACAAPAQAGALCATDDDGSEAPVVDAAGNPVPFNTRYDAADNRTHTRQRGYGVAAQVAIDKPVAGRENHVYVGATVDQGRIRFRSQSTVATLDIDRGTLPTALVDPTSPVAVELRRHQRRRLRQRHLRAAAGSLCHRVRALQSIGALRSRTSSATS